MAADSYGNYAFGLHDAKVATWTATATYGTAVDVPNAKNVVVTPEFITGKQTGDDAIVAVASRLIGVDVTLTFGSMSLAALVVIMGQATASSVSSPNEVKQFKPSLGAKMPNIGLSAVAYSENDSGSYNLFVPKMKLMSINFGGMEYGNFKDVEATFYGVADATYSAFQLIEQETAVTTAVVPPANIA
jgi:hypothetical protein